jgi:cytohesin
MVPVRSLKRKLDNVSLAAVANEGRWDDVLAMVESASLAIDAVSELGRTALWLAAKEYRADVVEVLLQAGADVNKADDDGSAPLSAATSAPIATMLIERGASVNATNTLGQTALLCAAQEDRADVVGALLQAGADVNKADEDGFAPLSAAASASIATMLIERGADVNAANRFGSTALLLAADAGRVGVVEALLQADADVNKADDDGDAPLTVAASASIATMLIERGADLNAANRFGATALLRAAQNGCADVVEALLQAGADVNKADDDGFAPLSAAASARIATMLIERGADVNAANRFGGTALLLAAQEDRADVVETLLLAGADANKADEKRLAPLSVAASAAIATMLIEHGAHVNAANRSCETALQIAAVEGRADVVEALVQAGADVMADVSGRLPLTVAADRGQWSLVTLLTRLSRHANVDALSSRGKTALWLALEHDEPEAREAATDLIRAGADVDFQWRWSGTSLLRSVAWRSADNVLLLLAAGAATADVSAFDCCNRDVMVLMMAGGVVWTELEIEQAIRRFGYGNIIVDDDDNNIDDDIDEWCMETLAQILSQVPAAKKRIEQAGFAAIRARVLEICIALQSLEIPAPQLIEIVTQACAPFAAQLPYHYLWDAVVLVKHYHRRAK